MPFFVIISFARQGRVDHKKYEMRFPLDSVPHHRLGHPGWAAVADEEIGSSMLLS